jgi:Domain of unknown function (DUF4062)
MLHKKKFSIFISSSFKGFEVIRNTLIFETLRMDHIPVAMEFFSAGERLNKEFIDEEIKNCDIFVLLLAGRAGSPLDDTINFTEFEYDCALNHQKPIIALLLSDKRFAAIYESEKIDQNEYLNQFRNKIKKSDRVIEFYDKENEIPAKFNLALFKQANKITDERAGYIKSDAHHKLNHELASLTHLRGIPKEFIANPITNKIFRDLSKFEKSVPRLEKDVPEKKLIGELTWRLLGTSIFFDSSIEHIFFEGNTSCLYLSDEYQRFSTERTHSLRDKNSRGGNIIDFYTNSIWIYLNLLFMNEQLYGRLTLFPDPPVSTRYGVCFGDINKLALANPGHFASERWTLRPDAEKAVKSLSDQINKLLQGTKGLIFCSSTGLQIAEHPLYAGPWSRSYYPTLFRRALLMSDSAVIFLIDGRKWDRNFGEEQPFPIFSKAEWTLHQNNKPIGFCMTTYIEAKRDEIKKYFMKQDYRIIMDIKEVSGRNIWIIIALSPTLMQQFREPL